MEENMTLHDLHAQLIELEERFMDMIEIADSLPRIVIPLELDIKQTLREIERLESLILLSKIK